MAIVVVGGHSRKIGKTSVVVGIIGSFPGFPWTAIKISSHWHSESPSVQSFDLYEECDRTSKTDTSRFLEAGASRSIWMRAEEDSFEPAVQQLMPIIQSSQLVIIESNRILKYIEPDLFIFVLRFDVGEFKESAGKIISRADAIVAVNYCTPPPAWKGISPGDLGKIPIFVSQDPQIIPLALVEFVRSRLFPMANGKSLP
jgi:hypothetical protein